MHDTLRLLFLLALVGLIGCAPGRRGSDDDDASDDDDSAADDDDATGDDDDATGDDDDSTGAGDDDDSTGDDDDAAGDCNIALTLQTGNTTSCNDSWSENGVSLQFRTGTCGSGCSGEAGSKGTWVYPAELYGDLTSLDCTPGQVTVDFIDYTGTGAVDVVIYNGGGSPIVTGNNTTVGTAESVTLSGQDIEGFGISGCETVVVGVRID